MTLLALIKLLLLLPISSFFPGYFLVRRRRFTAAEMICVSIGLSLVMLYLAAGCIYVSGVDWRWCGLLSGAWVVLAVISARDFVRFVAKSRVRRMFGGFFLILAIALLFQASIAHYSGDRWAGDWLEHFDRTRFFLERQPVQTLFIYHYILPARPPMSHLISAYFLAQAGAGFDLFQIVSTFLNALAFFPCVMLAGHIRIWGPRRAWLIAAMLITAPMFLQNVTFPWNKQLCAFFVLSSIGLYLRGWLSHRPGHIVLAAAMMAAGVLVHYSAALMRCCWRRTSR